MIYVSLFVLTIRFKSYTVYTARSVGLEFGVRLKQRSLLFRQFFGHGNFDRYVMIAVTQSVNFFQSLTVQTDSRVRGCTRYYLYSLILVYAFHSYRTT